MTTAADDDEVWLARLLAATGPEGAHLLADWLGIEDDEDLDED